METLNLSWMVSGFLSLICIYLITTLGSKENQIKELTLLQKLTLNKVILLDGVIRKLNKANQESGTPNIEITKTVEAYQALMDLEFQSIMAGLSINKDNIENKPENTK